MNGAAHLYIASGAAHLYIVSGAARLYIASGAAHLYTGSGAAHLYIVSGAAAHSTEQLKWSSTHVYTMQKLCAVYFTIVIRKVVSANGKVY